MRERSLRGSPRGRHASLFSPYTEEMMPGVQALVPIRRIERWARILAMSKRLPGSKISSPDGREYLTT